VIRDRGALAREVAPGVIENVYRLQIMNTDEQARSFTIAATGLPNLKVVGVEQPVAIGAAETRLLPVRVQAPIEGEARGEREGDDKHERGRSEEAEEMKPGPHKIEFIVQAVNDDKVVRHERSSFIVPR